MKLISKMPATLVMLGGIALVGCKTAGPSGSPASTATTMPTAIPVPEGQGRPVGPQTMPVPPASQTEIVLPAGTPPAAKDLTHVLTKDQPFYLNEPGADPKAVGTLKEGSKVLLMSPGSTYSQVTTDKGISAYTLTEGLKALGK